MIILLGRASEGSMAAAAACGLTGTGLRRCADVVC